MLDSELKANTVHIPHLPHVVAPLTVAGTILHVVYMNVCQKTLQVRTAPQICLHLGCTDVLRERGCVQVKGTLTPMGRGGREGSETRS